MTDETDARAVDVLANRLRIAHRASLLALAASAAFIASRPESSSQEAPAMVFAYTALALGVGAIFSRQRAVSPACSAGARLLYSIACYAFSASIGGVAIALVMLEGQRQAALLYVLGGAILALRAPRFASKQPTDRSRS